MERIKEQKAIKERTNGVIIFHFQYQTYEVSNEASLQVAELVNIS
jgi:hypothetical protein